MHAPSERQSKRTFSVRVDSIKVLKKKLNKLYFLVLLAHMFIILVSISRLQPSIRFQRSIRHV